MQKETARMKSESAEMEAETVRLNEKYEKLNAELEWLESPAGKAERARQKQVEENNKLLAQAAAMEADIKVVLDKWIGRTEHELIADRFWGLPQKVYETGGIKYLLYELSKVEIVQSATPSTTTTNINTNAYSNDQWEGVKTDTEVTTSSGRPEITQERPCKITFDFQNERMVRWRRQGWACHYLLMGK
ncbi:MAG: hypothetical protein V4660_17935 [Pseudomonadota bacterium]